MPRARVYVAPGTVLTFGILLPNPKIGTSITESSGLITSKAVFVIFQWFPKLEPSAVWRKGAKLTREHTVDADDMRAVFAAGASRQQIDDALAVCFSFNAIGRLADAFGFYVPGPDVFEAGAKYLLARGYR